MIYSIKILFLCIFIFTSVVNAAFDGNYVFRLESATQIEIDAIVTPQAGTLLRNSTDNKAYYYSGTKWCAVCDVPTVAVVPYITDNLITAPLGQTSVIRINGNNFSHSSVVSIPSFTGTINSTTVLSPFSIDLNITPAVVGIFDINISNGTASNTQWVGNGVGLLNITNENGQTQSVAGLTCKAILDDGFSTGDGMYWINPNAGTTADAFQVYCDMITDDGGWTRIEYAADLAHQKYFPTGSDANRWLNNNFTFTLTDTQINNIRAASTEGKQRYHGTCQGVLHYYHTSSVNHNFAFGFRYHQGHETVFSQELYPSTDITVPYDGCSANSSTFNSTDFDIIDIRVPVLNVNSRDNGSNSERFGSPLTQYPAWLR